MPVDLQPVDSSHIKAIGRDTEGGHTHVVFKDGAHWRYRDVPDEKHERFFGASSVGGFFAKHIKNSHDAERL